MSQLPISLVGMIQALRIVIIALAETHPDKDALKAKLRQHMGAIQTAAASQPHDALLFETEAELEKFLSAL